MTNPEFTDRVLNPGSTNPTHRPPRLGASGAPARKARPALVLQSHHTFPRQHVAGRRRLAGLDGRTDGSDCLALTAHSGHPTACREACRGSGKKSTWRYNRLHSLLDSPYVPDPTPRDHKRAQSYPPNSLLPTPPRVPAGTGDPLPSVQKRLYLVPLYAPKLASLRGLH
jgi:hypothetical protein